MGNHSHRRAQPEPKACRDSHWLHASRGQPGDKETGVLAPLSEVERLDFEELAE
jgi:hypothetical protein